MFVMAAKARIQKPVSLPVRWAFLHVEPHMDRLEEPDYATR
jgi:hypothetical protein